MHVRLPVLFGQNPTQRTHPSPAYHCHKSNEMLPGTACLHFPKSWKILMERRVWAPESSGVDCLDLDIYYKMHLSHWRLLCFLQTRCPVVVRLGNPGTLMKFRDLVLRIRVNKLADACRTKTLIHRRSKLAGILFRKACTGGASVNSFTTLASHTQNRLSSWVFGVCFGAARHQPRIQVVLSGGRHRMGGTSWKAR